MKIKKGAWHGAQPRAFVLKVLREHGVEVSKNEDNYYLLVDRDGDPVIVHLPNPVLSESIVYLYRRFGALHGFQITDLVDPNRRH